MPDLDTLRALAERLGRATGPDRELDRALTELVYVREERHLGTQENDGSGWKPCTTAVWVDPITGNWTTSAKDGMEYTASMDAAKAFRERLLPGWDWSIRNATSRDGDMRYCNAQVWEHPHEGPSIYANAPDGQPALAMVAATIAALIKREEAREC